MCKRDLQRAEIDRPYRVGVPVEGWGTLDRAPSKIDLKGVVEHWVRGRNFAGKEDLGYQSLEFEEKMEGGLQFEHEDEGEVLLLLARRGYPWLSGQAADTVPELQ